MRQSQRNKILTYLEKGGGITSLQAMRWYGCLRLGARIHDLRRLGYAIYTKTLKTETGKHVAQYFLRNPKEVLTV